MREYEEEYRGMRSRRHVPVATRRFDSLLATAAMLPAPVSRAAAQGFVGTASPGAGYNVSRDNATVTVTASTKVAAAGISDGTQGTGTKSGKGIGGTVNVTSAGTMDPGAAQICPRADGRRVGANHIAGGDAEGGSIMLRPTGCGAMSAGTPTFWSIRPGSARATNESMRPYLDRATLRCGWAPMGSATCRRVFDAGGR